MSYSPVLAVVVASLSVALAFGAPASAAQKKPKFTKALATLEIDTSGKFAVACTSVKARKGCRTLYTAVKTRSGKPLFNKVKAAKAKFKVQGRYWEQCDSSGNCYIVYNGTGGLYGGEY